MDTGPEPSGQGPATAGERLTGGRRPKCLLGHVPKLLRLCERLKLLQRLVLDLADPLTRNVERATHLVERARVLAAEAVTQLEYATLAIAEVLERFPECLFGEDLRGTLVRGLGPF